MIQEGKLTAVNVVTTDLIASQMNNAGKGTSNPYGDSYSANSRNNRGFGTEKSNSEESIQISVDGQVVIREESERELKKFESEETTEKK